MQVSAKVDLPSMGADLWIRFRGSMKEGEEKREGGIFALPPLRKGTIRKLQTRPFKRNRNALLFSNWKLFATL